jgi:CRISPR system Cascade subunit CasA
VRRASGARQKIRPAEIATGVEDDPMVTFDWPRPDLDAGARELLIGLLSTACWRQIVDDWEDWWHGPPDPATLDACFAPFRDAFLLDGPGPRFVQDIEELKSNGIPIGGLLIDAPNASTLAQNKDLFNKRGMVSLVSRPAAAISLFTLQAFAPQGGRGHRTSLRGGGPLGTFLASGRRGFSRFATLWHELWTNVFWSEDEWPDPTHQPERVFPWLVPTRVSDKGQITTPEDVHPAQAFWGMPRRIRLDFQANDERAGCDLTGEIDSVVVRSFRMRPSGTNYEAWSLGHPLTPYRREKPGDVAWLPVRARPGRLGYRDWVGLVLADEPGANVTRAPAAAIAAAERRFGFLPREIRLGARLAAAGYAMDRQRPIVAVSFVESEMAVRIVAQAVQHDFEVVVRNLVLGAREAQGILASSIRHALWNREAPGANAGARGLARERFWDETERPFHDAVADLAEALEQASDDDAILAIMRRARERWRDQLRQRAFAIFDTLVPLDEIEERRFERVENGRSLPGGPIVARRNLRWGFYGYGKAGNAFYSKLGLPPPESKRKGSKAA